MESLMALNNLKNQQAALPAVPVKRLF